MFLNTLAYAARMKILVLNPFEMTAATTIRMEQLSRVIARRHKVVFVSYGEKEARFRRGGIEYILFRKRFASPFFHFHQMWLKFRACMREDYDLVYISKPLLWALLPAVLARMFRKKRFILDWDEHEYAIISRISKNPLYLWTIGVIERFGVKRADALIVVSPYLRQLALKWGYNMARIALVQNGVDPDNFKVIINQKEMRKKYGVEGRIAMFLGSLRPQFDIDLVIRAMPLVKKEVEDAKFVIVGGGSDKAYLEKLAKQMGLGSSVVFLGPQPYELVPSLIRMADVVVAPNRRNEMNLSRSPVKIAEYMAVGTPIVANAVGLAEDMLKDGAGELVYSEAPEEMAEKIVAVLKNKGLAERLAEKSRERVRRLYTWERLGAILERFIEDNFII